MLKRSNLVLSAVMALAVIMAILSLVGSSEFEPLVLQKAMLRHLIWTALAVVLLAILLVRTMLDDLRLMLMIVATLIATVGAFEVIAFAIYSDPFAAFGEADWLHLKVVWAIAGGILILSLLPRGLLGKLRAWAHQAMAQTAAATPPPSEWVGSVVLPLADVPVLTTPRRKRRSGQVAEQPEQPAAAMPQGVSEFWKSRREIAVKRAQAYLENNVDQEVEILLRHLQVAQTDGACVPAYSQLNEHLNLHYKVKDEVQAVSDDDAPDVPLSAPAASSPQVKRFQDRLAQTAAKLAEKPAQSSDDQEPAPYDRSEPDDAIWLRANNADSQPDDIELKAAALMGITPEQLRKRKAEAARKEARGGQR